MSIRVSKQYAIDGSGGLVVVVRVQEVVTIELLALNPR